MITSIDSYVNSCNARQNLAYYKAAQSTSVANTFMSTWRILGSPSVATTPTTPVTCNNTTQGGLQFTNPTGGAYTYLSKITYISAVLQSIELHDRLAHMGGLSCNTTATQTVGLSIPNLSGTDNLANRIPGGDYSQLLWWLEWYGTSGGTATTITVSYTNQNGVSGRTSSRSFTNATASSRMVQILPMAGDIIYSVESITFSTATGTVGNVGVTVTNPITEVMCTAVNNTMILDWTQTEMPRIQDSSCLSLILGITSNTASGTIRGAVTLVQV